MNTSTDFAAPRRATQSTLPHGNRARVLARRLMLCALAAAPMIFAAGCESIKAVEIEDPKPIPTPPKGIVFSAGDHITPGIPMPGTYRVREVLSAELLTIEGVTAGEGGALKGSGVLQTIRLAGIVAPQPGQRGWEGSVKAVRNWTLFNRLNPTVELESDSKFPIDLNGRAMMQVYFKGTSERTQGTRFNLNRMLIRSGWAVADLNAATSIDLQQWLNDEEYARMHNLGLRKYGIILGQRLPSPGSKTAGAKKMGAGSSMRVMPGAPAATTSSVTATSGSTSTSTSSTVTTMPGTSMPGAPMPPGMSGNAMSSPMAGNVARP